MAPSTNPAAPAGTLADGVRSTIASTVMAATPAGTRNQIVAAAAKLAGLAVANGPLDVLAAEATLLLQQDPMLAANGVAVAARRGAIRAARRGVGTSPQRRSARATRVADQPEPPVAIALHRTVTRAGGRREVQTIRQGLLDPLHRAALSGAAHGGDGKAMLLGAGAGLVWRVPKNYRGALAGDGALPLRIVAVGANGWPILDVSGDGTVDLPENSRFVAVFAAALPATEPRRGRAGIQLSRCRRSPPTAWSAMTQRCARRRRCCDEAGGCCTISAPGKGARLPPATGSRSAATRKPGGS